MRAALSVLLFALLAAAPAAQEAFSDPDFAFTMQVPAGLKAMDDAARARVLGSPEAARNVPRAEAAGQPLKHAWFWHDATSPYNRQLAIYLVDGPPPCKPEDFGKLLQGEGLEVVAQESLKAAAGMLVEGTFLREPDQVRMHKYALYVPDLFGKRHAVVTLQAYDADWKIVQPELRKAAESVRMERAPPPPEVLEQMKQRAAEGGAPGAAGARPVPPAGPGSAGPQAPGDWGSLEVVGSLVLAGAALAHLLLAGRGPR